MDPYEIVRAFERSALVYGDLSLFRHQKNTTVIDDAASEVQALIVKENNTLYITFRGSNSKKDWQTNLTFWQKTIPYGNTASKIRVHTGFIQAYKSPGVRDKIHALMTSDVLYIQVAGHSHGAALSILCAVDLEYNFPRRDYRVFLFGCPRVGNRAFQKSYDRRVPQTVRVENGNDIITKIPFASWGFHHVGTLLHIGPPRLPLVYSCNDHQLEPYGVNVRSCFAFNKALA